MTQPVQNSYPYSYINGGVASSEPSAIDQAIELTAPNGLIGGDPMRANFTGQAQGSQPSQGTQQAQEPKEEKGFWGGVGEFLGNVVDAGYNFVAGGVESLVNTVVDVVTDPKKLIMAVALAAISIAFPPVGIALLAYGGLTATSGLLSSAGTTIGLYASGETELAEQSIRDVGANAAALGLTAVGARSLLRSGGAPTSFNRTVGRDGGITTPKFQWNGFNRLPSVNMQGRIFDTTKPISLTETTATGLRGRLTQAWHDQSYLSRLSLHQAGNGVRNLRNIIKPAGAGFNTPGQIASAVGQGLSNGRANLTNFANSVRSQGASVENTLPKLDEARATRADLLSRTGPLSADDAALLARAERDLLRYEGQVTSAANHYNGGVDRLVQLNKERNIAVNAGDAAAVARLDGRIADLQARGSQVDNTVITRAREVRTQQSQLTDLRTQYANADDVAKPALLEQINGLESALNISRFTRLNNSNVTNGFRTLNANNPAVLPGLYANNMEATALNDEIARLMEGQGPMAPQPQVPGDSFYITPADYYGLQQGYA